MERQGKIDRERSKNGKKYLWRDREREREREREVRMKKNL